MRKSFARNLNGEISMISLRERYGVEPHTHDVLQSVQ
jgi:hypothetical protein